MSLDTEVDRRKFVAGIAALVGGGIVLNTLGRILEQPESKNQLQVPDFSAQDHFTTSNLENYADLVKKESGQFDLLTQVNLPMVQNYSDLETIPNIIPQGKDLSQFGIKSIGFGEDNGDLVLLTRFIENVRLGKTFLNPNTPWPAALFITDKKSNGFVTPAGYDPRGRNGEPIDSLFIHFPELAQYRDLEFAVRLSPGLLNVQGKELEAFSIPYRFLISPVGDGSPKNAV